MKIEIGDQLTIERAHYHFKQVFTIFFFLHSTSNSLESETPQKATLPPSIIKNPFDRAD